jgi:GWxTD domain-containing protein
LRSTAVCVLLLVGHLLGPGGQARGGVVPSEARHRERPQFTAMVSPCVDRESTYVFLQVEVPYRELSFRRIGSRLEASFDIIVHVFREERQVTGDLWSETVRIGDRRELGGVAASFRKDISLPLAPGEYELDVRVTEPGSGQTGRVRLGARLPERAAGKIAVSSLLIGECGLLGGISELRRDPRIRRRYATAVDSLCAYLEIYHAGISASEIALRWRLLGWGGEILASGEMTAARGPEATAVNWSFATGDLWIGEYRLEAVVGVAGEQTEVAARIHLLGETDPSLAEFFADLLDVLAYIADEKEMLPLRMASAQERKALWDEFWQRRDPTPESDYNEYKEEFFRRLRFANENFGVLREGWRTDRGRIYIQHGDPDQVTRGVHPASRQAMEVWHYDHLGARFVFVDRNGFGDYVLAGPAW